MKILQWSARGIDVFLVSLSAAFMIGEGVPSPLSLTASELACGAAFAMMMVGLLAAWKWEGVGSLLILLGFALFWSVNAAATGSLSLGWVFVVFALAGLMFAAHWWWTRKPPAGK